MIELTSFRVDKYEVYDKDEADAAIAGLEADHASVAKAYDGRYRELMEARASLRVAETARDNMMQEMYERLEQAEAMLAERDRMLRLAWKEGHLPIDSIEIWLAGLRARAGGLAT